MLLKDRPFGEAAVVMIHEEVQNKRLSPNKAYAIHSTVNEMNAPILKTQTSRLKTWDFLPHIQSVSHQNFRKSKNRAHLNAFTFTSRRKRNK